jgi:hypothetical protein
MGREGGKGHETNTSRQRRVAMVRFIYVCGYESRTVMDITTSSTVALVAGYRSICTGRCTNRHTHTQTDEGAQTDRPTDIQTDLPTYIYTDKQTDLQTGR